MMNDRNEINKLWLLLLLLHIIHLKPINITSSCIDRPLIKRLEYKSMLLDKNGFFIENELLAKQ